MNFDKYPASVALTARIVALALTVRNQTAPIMWATSVDCKCRLRLECMKATLRSHHAVDGGLEQRCRSSLRAGLTRKQRVLDSRDREERKVVSR